MFKFLAATISLAVVATSTQAADWRSQTTDIRPGTFVGARLRVPLGSQRASSPRAALTIAPTQSRISQDGMIRTGIGEGFALNFTRGSKPSLTLAGVRADQALGLQQGRSVGGTRLGVSTGGWVAIGVGVAALVGGLVVLNALKEADEHSD